MRFLRFSLRKLLVLVAIVAVLTYMFFLRPTVIAKRFIHDLETSSDVKAVADKYFDGRYVEGAKISGELKQRSWADILRCKQIFTIQMKMPPSKQKVRGEVVKIADVTEQYYYSGPLGVHFVDGPVEHVEEVAN